MPILFIVARDPALTAIVWAKMRVSPTTSNPCRSSSRDPSLAYPWRQCRRTRR